MAKKAHLKDGAFLSLSEGAQMTVVSSFNEIIDNFYGKQASKINIVYKKSENYLEFSAIEKNDLTEDNGVDKLYSLGVDHEPETQEDGVGKYNQGFKYSVAHLVGKGNKGIVRVDSKPDNGEPWASKQEIDYTNPKKYRDQDILTTEDGVIYDNDDKGYNFRIRIYGCRIITDKEMSDILITLGLRYRNYIEQKKYIYYNDCIVNQQDRLYQSLGDNRIQYKSEYIPYKNNSKAVLFEHVDLEDARIEQIELIKYDIENGRKKSVANTSRGAIEIVYNGITVMYDNLPSEFKKLCGVDFQPIAASFRGRLTILDKQLYDKYFYGGNKSAVSVSKDFIIDDDTMNIRQSISKAYRNYCNRHNIHEKTTKGCSRNSSIIDNILSDTEIKVLFQECGDKVKPFDYDEKNKILYINENSQIFKKYTPSELLTYGVLYMSKSFGDALKELKRINAEIE